MRARLLFVAGLLIAGPVAADPLPEWLADAVAVHGQATVTLQATPAFRDPYEGDNSLKPDQARETVDATLYVGVRPWRGGEVWVNPEVDQGFGLSNTLGVAGFPSAEAYKVGQASPYVRLQRMFFRQTIDLGGRAERVAADQNQFVGTRSANRLVVTIGKFGVGDVFDINRYAHDPRQDVLNWRSSTRAASTTPRTRGATPPASPPNGTPATGRSAPGCSTCPPFPMARRSRAAFASISSTARWSAGSGTAGMTARRG